MSKDGKKWGITVSFVDEKETLRGTGGALRYALDEGALDSSFLLTYGDSFLLVSFQKIWVHFQF